MMLTFKITQYVACPFVLYPLLALNVTRSSNWSRSAARSQAHCAPPGPICLTSFTLRRERAKDDGASIPIAKTFLARFARLFLLTGLELQNNAFVLLWVTFFISVGTIIGFILTKKEVKFTKC